MKRVFFSLLLFSAPLTVSAQTPQLNVKLDTDEAEAVLHLVGLGPRITPSDWLRLNETEGYRRLKQREAAMKRAFTDAEFQAFVRTPELAQQAPALRRTLDAWARVIMDTAARRAFAYLPAHARIRATIYPSIKPRPNTFVWEPRTDPAIFFYLDPQMTAAQFENTLAHELHHLGVASVCTTDSLPLVQQWMSGFAEGRAVLAAVADPAVHPHAVSDSTERAVWDRDYARVQEDMRRLEAFFTDLLSGRLTQAEQSERGFAFVSTDSVPQGPFYTVGYHMARAVEQELGRERLVASLCDPVQFLEDYNSVAQRRGLPRWSAAFLRALRP